MTEHIECVAVLLGVLHSYSMCHFLTLCVADTIWGVCCSSYTLSNMISHIWRRSRIKHLELSAAVKLSSLKPYRNLGGFPVVVPRLNEKGLVLPLNEKNWNTFPSHRMPSTGTWSPCRVLFQQQATTLTYSQNQCNLLRNGCLTTTFCNHLSNCIYRL